MCVCTHLSLALVLCLLGYAVLIYHISLFGVHSYGCNCSLSIQRCNFFRSATESEGSTRRPLRPTWTSLLSYCAAFITLSYSQLFSNATHLFARDGILLCLRSVEMSGDPSECLRSVAGPAYTTGKPEAPKTRPAVLPVLIGPEDSHASLHRNTHLPRHCH